MSELTGHDVDLMCAPPNEFPFRAKCLSSYGVARARPVYTIQLAPGCATTLENVSQRYRKFLFEKILQTEYQFRVLDYPLEFLMAIRGAPDRYDRKKL